MNDNQLCIVIEALKRDKMITENSKDSFKLTENGGQLVVDVIEDWFYKMMNGEVDNKRYISDNLDNAEMMFTTDILSYLQPIGVLVNHYGIKAGYKTLKDI